MPRTRLSSKGQIIIPQSLRAAHGWKAGLEFEVREVEEGVLLTPLPSFPETTLDDVIGCLGYTGPARSLEEMEQAIRQGARARR